MTPVWGADEYVAKWVAGRIDGCERGFGECRAMAVLDNQNRVAAGIVFHDWNPERGIVEISCAAASRKWLTRTVAKACFGYAFAVSRMVVTRTSERNTPVARIWRALGATEYSIAGLWGPDEAGLIFTLTKPQWLASRLAR